MYEIPVHGEGVLTFPSSYETYEAFDWIVIKNTANLWRVTSYDTAFGHKSGTFSVVYRLGHWKSELSGFAVFPNPQDLTKSIALNWTETKVIKQIDQGYRSGYIRVQGKLMLGGATFLTPDGKKPFTVF